MSNPWDVAGALTASVSIDMGAPLELPGLGRGLILVNLPLCPGKSGDLLVDVHSRLVGINAMMAGPEAGLASRIHEVKQLLLQFLRTAWAAPFSET
jgi:S1-C subfamily serine protease